MIDLFSASPAKRSAARIAGDASNRTIYDGMGRTTGTAATSGNVTTFRDAMGRLTGTATRSPDGRIEFRDAQGRLTGTATNK
jgi:YD repeat-containing protein